MNLRNWKPAELTAMEFVSAITVKILLGVLYGYIFLVYYNGDDTWKIFEDSVKETALLIEDPAQFFTNEYTPLHSIEIASSWKEAIARYMGDLQYALFVKSLAIINLITGSNYYLDVVVFNLITFFGQYWLFRVFTKLFPGNRTLFYLAVFFFIPSVFWLSGLRIEGLALFFLSMFLFNLVHESRGRYIKMLTGLFAFAGLVICRVEVALLFLPAVLSWYVSKNTHKPALTFIGVYAVSLVLFFASTLLPGGGMPGKVAALQQKFMVLEGTRFSLDTLDTSAHSYINVFPQAVANTFIRPLPWEASGLLQAMASIEVITFWILLATAFFLRSEDWKLRLNDPVIVTLVFFSISVYLSIGYLVPFPGAIVRYKTIAELLLICCMLAMVRSRYIKK